MKSFTQFLKEEMLIEAKHPIFKGLALPGGKGVFHDHETGTYHWSKHGGYAHNTMAKLSASLHKAGWKKVDASSHATPDGSYMGSGTHHEKGQHTLKMSSTYGNVKSDNSHYVHINRKT